MNTVTIIAMPQRAIDGGISPIIRRAFSERSSILSCVGLSVPILVSEFKLVFNEVVVRAFLFDERGVVAGFDDLASVEDNNPVCILYG